MGSPFWEFPTNYGGTRRDCIKEQKLAVPSSPGEDASSIVTKILSLERGMLLAHQAHSSYRRHRRLKLEAPEGAVLSTTLWSHRQLRTWSQVSNTACLVEQVQPTGGGSPELLFSCSRHWCHHLSSTRLHASQWPRAHGSHQTAALCCESNWPPSCKSSLELGTTTYFLNLAAGYKKEECDRNHFDLKCLRFWHRWYDNDLGT